MHSDEEQPGAPQTIPQISHLATLWLRPALVDGQLPGSHAVASRSERPESPSLLRGRCQVCKSAP